MNEQDEEPLLVGLLYENGITIIEHNEGYYAFADNSRQRYRAISKNSDSFEFRFNNTRDIIDGGRKYNSKEEAYKAIKAIV